LLFIPFKTDDFVNDNPRFGKMEKHYIFVRIENASFYPIAIYFKAKSAYPNFFISFLPNCYFHLIISTK